MKNGRFNSKRFFIKYGKICFYPMPVKPLTPAFLPVPDRVAESERILVFSPFRRYIMISAVN
jgi:hypothetical protein